MKSFLALACHSEFKGPAITATVTQGISQALGIVPGDLIYIVPGDLSPLGR